jgi:hypothetical protein
VDNRSVAGGWLDAWYPGDDIIDVIAPTFWCTGQAPGSGGDTLATAQVFADAHGKPLGLAGFGVDHQQFTTAQGQAYISYVQRLFTARNAAAKPSYDLLWLGTGNYSILTAPPALLASYRALAEALWVTPEALRRLHASSLPGASPGLGREPAARHRGDDLRQPDH